MSEFCMKIAKSCMSCARGQTHTIATWDPAIAGDGSEAAAVESEAVEEMPVPGGAMEVVDAAVCARGDCRSIRRMSLDVWLRPWPMRSPPYEISVDGRPSS